MIYNLIALGLIIFFLVIITFILAKKLPRLKTMDVDTIAEEKEDQVKERILIQRLRRKAKQSKEIVAKTIKPSGQKAKSFFAKKHHVKDPVFQQQLNDLLEAAQELFKEEDYAEAEKKYIEVISLDQQNKAAYRGLADLYRQKKEYQQAIQTLKYVLRLDLKQCQLKTKKHSRKKAHGQPAHVCVNAEEITEDYLELGEVYQALGEPGQALVSFQHAFQHSPNDPKTLDLLIETCIQLKDRSSAVDYFKLLHQVNPENQKLLEYKKKLDSL
jgi:tetratricopeptide (TPR) repeat protein